MTLKVFIPQELQEVYGGAERDIDLIPVLAFQYGQLHNFQFNMSLLNPKFKVLHSHFECKDFLQDMFWAEYNKKSAVIWGLNWKPGTLDINSPKFLIIYHGGPEILENKAENMQKFINILEDILHIPRTVVMKTNDPYYMVAEFDHEWTTLSSFFSAYQTIFRLGGAYKGEDPFVYLDKAAKLGGAIEPKFSSKDAANLLSDECEGGKAYYKKALALFHGMRPTTKWTDLSNTNLAHHKGIMGDNSFPEFEG
jgi:hypothetical protein